MHDVWTVHSKYHVEMVYPGNVRMILDNNFENGIRFEGDEGWIFCTRDEVVAATGSSPDPAGREMLPPLRASDSRLLSTLDGNATRWPPSKSHHGNWLEGIAAGRQPIAPIQQSARSLEACAAAWIGMKRQCRLDWDVRTEMFVGDPAANALRSRRARRTEFDFEQVMKRAGIA